MEIMAGWVELLTHFDVQLRYMIDHYGYLTYGILFVIIFCETGLVVMPFLPGDSLLFISGTFAALGILDIRILLVLLVLAAALGNMLNYQIGRWVGPKVFNPKNLRFIKKSYLVEAKAFLNKHGVLAIVLSRFVPIVRTFAPFVAGVGNMNYKAFTLYNLIGALAWTLLFTLMGYFFGNIPMVQDNYSMVIGGILVISVMPVVLTIIKEHLKSKCSVENEK